jgi:hypothetical protein
MPKLEYRVCVVRRDAPGQLEEELNSKLKGLGEEGWRFVETIYAQNSLPVLLFKKQTKTATFPQGKPSKQK